MKKRTIVILITIAVSLIVLPAILFAQEADPAADPTYAEINLSARFELDPYIVRVIGESEVDASTVSSECAGFIPAVPSVVINWTGDIEVLRLYTYTNDDPVMVVVTPGGDVLCNDDMNPVVLDAAVEIDNPMEGRYAVHVGSYAAGTESHGFLAVTELDYNIATTDLSPLLIRREIDPVLSAPSSPASALNRAPRGIFGDDELEAGFGTVEVVASAGGDVPTFNFDLGSIQCTGFIGLVPTYTFSLTEDVDSLRVLFNGEEDTTLIVEEPDGTFRCNDDTDGEANINPTVDVERASAGDYRVYVGSYDQRVGIRGTLIVAEGTDVQADVLEYQAVETE